MYDQSVINALAKQAIQDEMNADGVGALGMPAGALAGSAMGVTAAMPFHYMGQQKLNQLDQTNPYYEVTRRDNAGAPTAMNVKGAIPRKELLGNKVRPGARMAGGLMGALVGGALGAGTAELIKRESPSARLIAKIQTQGGRLTPQDEQLMENILTNAYSNMSDYR